MTVLIRNGRFVTAIDNFTADIVIDAERIYTIALAGSRCRTSCPYRR